MNRLAATWNLFVLFDNEAKKTLNNDDIFRSVLEVRGQSKCMGNSADYVT